MKALVPMVLARTSETRSFQERTVIKSLPSYALNCERYQSWGRFPRTRQEVIRLTDRDAQLPVRPGDGPYLPFGNGRSYGDSCLNDGGVLLDCRSLNRLIEFDVASGVLRCEAGLLLSEMLELAVPHGWFLPVTPGTKFVTVGGAIANDVHGKNHHRRGTFGNHVRAFELLRSDNSRRICTPVGDDPWFAATVGGLGLTGVITWAELQLIPIASDSISRRVVAFESLDEFMELTRASNTVNEYNVAWINTAASSGQRTRGLFISGDHAEPEKPTLTARGGPTVSVPFTPPFALVNRTSLKLFNSLYFHLHAGNSDPRMVHFDPFFYPLDRVGAWNRLYGPSGILQHQSVVPQDNGIQAVRELLTRTQRSGLCSLLTVLKVFGSVPSAGIMSFPRPGLTLTLDFPNQGAATFRLLDELDAVTLDAGGAVNPYKDSRMAAATFKASFPRWRDLEPFIDPLFSSSFWRRVAGND